MSACAAGHERLPDDELREIRRSRRHPRPTQFDYLHLRYLVRDLAAALERAGTPENVLDVFCGTRPYEDLFPPGARCVGLDVDYRYGAADVVTREFLPFPDASFDLLLCTEAFHYVPDPAAGVAEIRRVLRPGGTVLITVPFVWEYDRRILEHRYTGPELAALFEAWEGVEVAENGGRVVSWATLSGRLLNLLEQRLSRRRGVRGLVRLGFASTYLLLNGLAFVLDHAERRWLSAQPNVLPMNLLLVARRPSDE